MARGDQKWLESLNCITARGGIHGTVIEANSLGLKMRMKPLTGNDVTMWSESNEFVGLNGGGVAAWGEPSRSPPAVSNPATVSAPVNPLD